MPSTRAHRYARRALADIESVDAKAARHIRRIARAIALDVLRLVRARRNPMRALLSRRAELIDLSIDAMVTAHLLGRRRVALEVAPRMEPVSAAYGFGDAYSGAVAFLRKRLNLSSSDLADLRRLYGAEATRVVDTAMQWQERAVQKAVLETVQEGLHTQAGIARVRSAMEGVGLSAKPHVYEAVFRTQSALAYSAGQSNALEDPDVAEIVEAYEFVTVGDDRVRPEHEALEGFVAAADDPIWNTHTPPLGWNCFAPNTSVSGRIVGASRMRYQGQMIEITTRQGRKVTITPNHPVAVPWGFVPAHTLAKGNNLVVDRRDVGRFSPCSTDDAIALVFGLRRHEHKDQMPARIKDVFDALRVRAARPIAARVTPLDFHGDAQWSDGQVDVVWPYRFLPTHGPYSELLFKHRPELFNKVAGAKPSSSTRQRSGRGDALRERLLSSSRRAPGVAALSINDGWVVVPPLSGIPFDPFCFGPSSDLDVRLDEPAGQSAASDAMLFSKLIDRFAGAIVTDEIVDIRRFDFDAHVYDLQSDTGYLTASGIVMSNCRCQKIPYLEGDNYQLKPAPRVATIDGETITPGPDPGWAFDPGRVFRDTIERSAA